MFEQHIFPDGPKIFNRLTNEYINESDGSFQAWINETRLVYTYETQQQEVEVIVVDPETGEETTTTELQDVTVAIPVMVTTEDGNEVQATELINTPITINMMTGGIVGSTVDEIDELREQLTATNAVLLDVIIGEI